ncbi:hypothetical protein [Shimazuella alba]|uniref:Uncharacterized protein n=1 Tax=Shimazuella alba TaxID=2690964 RepID=A0A6I4W1Y9_9BACL|nr:hypothetical protein [Shimazuella alba]MXQ54292.1 hypothetical protein [Shimazuella alba]
MALQSGRPFWWVNDYYNDHPKDSYSFQRSLRFSQMMFDGLTSEQTPSLQGEADFIARCQKLLESVKDGNVQVARLRLRALRNHFDADVILKCELDNRSSRVQSTDEEKQLAEAVFQESDTSVDRAHLLGSAQYFERRAMELSN